MPSKLAAKCRACPFVDTCGRKQMEALAYFTEPLKIEVEVEKGLHDSFIKSHLDAVEKRYIKNFNKDGRYL